MVWWNRSNQRSPKRISVRFWPEQLTKFVILKEMFKFHDIAIIYIERGEKSIIDVVQIIIIILLHHQK